MIVLKIIGWIILIFLALQLLLLIITSLLLTVKVTLGLDFGENGTKVKLKWGFFKINLYPEQFTPERIEWYKSKLKPFIVRIKARKQNKNTEKKVEQPKEKMDIDEIWAKIKAFDFEGAYAKAKDMFEKLGGFGGTIEILQYIASKTKVMFTKVLKHIVIKELFVDLTVAGNDAADTAMNYGKTCAAVFPALGTICTNMKVREYNVDINPDFIAKKNNGDLHTVIAFRPIFILMALTGFGTKIINKIIFKLLFSHGKSNENIKEEQKLKI
ncbi:MAG: DUF2953 domain-containing protein [Clostridia bacterium]|nr:DUF2953 domain-containing protein [Clostridia bacterium]